MKIVLARPSYHTHLITPPLGLGYISAYLKKHGFNETKLLDGLNYALSNEKISDICQEYGCELLGISVLTDYYSEVCDLIGRCKKKGIITVIGGPHVTAVPKKSLEGSGADFAVVGEGEESMLDLANHLSSGTKAPIDIKGVYKLNNGNIKDREFIKDIDSLPLPDWEQMNPKSYEKAPHGGLIKNFPVAPIISSRGCPFACSFCASPFIWKQKIRFRSPKNVVDEIELLVQEFGVKEIHFEDDNLTLKKSHVEQICQEIIARNLKISWATPNGIRVETVTPELLSLMKKSGCYYLAFGIESGNQRILDNIHKKTNLEIIEYAVRESKKAGIITQGFFIFGLPGETEETINETIRFAKKIPLDRAQFLLLDLLPGSELFHKLGTSTNLSPSSYRSYQDVTWIPEGLCSKTLQNAPSKAFRSFFFRPRQMLTLLKFFKLSQLKFILQRISDFNIFKIKH